MAIEAAVFIDELVNTNPPGGDDASTIDDHLRLIKAVLLNTLGALSGAVTTTDVELEKLAGYAGAIPELGTAQAWTAQQHFTEATLTDAVTVAWDTDVAQTAKVTLAGNRTLGAPSNMNAGAAYILRIIQDATGARTLAYNAVFLFQGGSAPVLSTAANSVDILSCYSDGMNMHCTMTLDFS